MNHLTVLFATILLLLTGTALAEPVPATAHILANLRTEHPRLLLTDARLAELKDLAANDAALRNAAGAAVALARLHIERPPVVDSGDWNTWREVLARTFATAFAWRWTGDRAFFDKGKETLLAAAAFENWHPDRSFLDTAEMTLAMAIGYDWLHAELAEADRLTIRAAIVDKGLKAGLNAYNGRAWWIRCNHNWNLVCNGGMVVGSLAIAETDPDVSASVLAAALKSMPEALAGYEPDGTWLEGPYYWEYSTRLSVMALASLQTALGTDFGLSDNKGLAATWRYAAHVTAPNRLNVMAYGDSLEHHWTLPFVFWAARRFEDPLASRYQMQYFGKPHPWWSDRAKEVADPRHAPNRVLDIIWYTLPPPDTPPLADALPRDALLRGKAELASFRSSWEDPKALWLMVKAGNNGGLVNHGHCDVGCFELYADGIRWSFDPGRAGYGAGYFDVGSRRDPGKRWTYAKAMARGHSTLLIGGADQDPFGVAPIVKFETTDELAFAVVDLSAVYTLAKSVRRGFQVLEHRAVLVQDEVELDQEREVVWAMTTEAEGQVDGSNATLKRWGKTLRAAILEPHGAAFEIEEPKDGLPRRLVARIKGQPGTLRLAILLTPGSATAPSMGLSPLDEWALPDPAEEEK